MNKMIRTFINVGLSLLVAAICALLIIVLYASAQLPSVQVLQDVQLQVPLRIYTQDGKLIGEYGEKRRTPVTLDQVPPKLIQAILATEDRRFYEHSGVDLRGLARAGLNLVLRGKKDQGASTITMQVARNFFLTRKKTFTRKLNEILLAIKIENELSKDKILELYINKIYFGKRAYGVAAAAEVYYGAEVSKLTLPQMAMLAGLPQAPSAINPLNDPESSIKRRNHVLKRMLHYGFITQAEYAEAIKAPHSAEYHATLVDIDAPYVAERARQEVVDQFGPEVYTSGYEVFTTVDSKLQTYAENSVQNALLAYDKRHGYRGPIKHVNYDGNNLKEALKELVEVRPLPQLVPALVLDVKEDSVKASLSSGETITIPFSGMAWAREVKRRGLGPNPQTPSDVLKIGDVIYAQPSDTTWLLGQYPEASAALVSLQPDDGSILALVGGYDFNASNFNRATQAMRQPGSNFKPFVYAAALENGFNAATIINDAPIVFNDPSLEGTWRPQNDTRKFYGPTRLRVGLAQSRNLVTIRLLKAMGMKNAFNTIEKFGFDKNSLPHGLALALGTLSTTPLKVASGYAVFANGGYAVTPHIISHIKDNSGKTIYAANYPKVCPSCEKQTDLSNKTVDTSSEDTSALTKEPENKATNTDPSLNVEEVSPFDEANDSENKEATDADDSAPVKNENLIEELSYSPFAIGKFIHVSYTPAVDQTLEPAPRVISPQTAFIMTSIMQDVIKTGTGKKALELKRGDIAGKTGTTQNKMDAWFSGFNRDMVTTVWMGFDEPKPLDEYGSEAALPLWMEFMAQALKGKAEHMLDMPPGIVSVKIDPHSGLLARPGQKNAIFEYFRENDVPSQTAQHSHEGSGETSKQGNGQSSESSMGTTSTETLF